MDSYETSLLKANRSLKHETTRLKEQLRQAEQSAVNAWWSVIGIAAVAIVAILVLTK